MCCRQLRGAEPAVLGACAEGPRDRPGSGASWNQGRVSRWVGARAAPQRLLRDKHMGITDGQGGPWPGRLVDWVWE